MANMLPGGGAMGGQFPLEQWFYEMPVCTRWWTTATVVTSILVQCHIITPFQLFYSFRAVWLKSQYWRLLSTFVYFGPLSLDLLFHIFFLQRYSRLLEESTPTRSHFSWLLFYASMSLLAISTLTPSLPFNLGAHLALPFLGTALSSTLVYIWSRKNPDVRLSFLGLWVFRAPFLPWVLIGFSLVLHGHLPKDEVCGVLVGHVWYFFNDVFPAMYGGWRPLDPPRWWRRIWEGPLEEAGGDDGTAARDMGRDIAVAAAGEVR